MILDDILSNYAQRLVAGQGRNMMAAEGMRYGQGGYYRDVYSDMDESSNIPDEGMYDDAYKIFAEQDRITQNSGNSSYIGENTPLYSRDDMTLNELKQVQRQKSMSYSRRQDELRSPKVSSSSFMYNQPLQVKQTPKDRDKGSFVAEGQSTGPKQGQFIAPSSRPFASGSGSGGGYSSGAGGVDGTRGGGFYYENESFNSYLSDIYNMNANADMVMERGGKYTYVDGGKF